MYLLTHNCLVIKRLGRLLLLLK